MGKRGPAPTPLTLEFFLGNTKEENLHPDMGLGPCRIWQGSKNAKGFPTFRSRGTPQVFPYVHRLVYGLFMFRTLDIGPIGDVKRRCKERLCIEPRHEFLVRRKVNTFPTILGTPLYGTIRIASTV